MTGSTGESNDEENPKASSHFQKNIHLFYLFKVIDLRLNTHLPVDFVAVRMIAVS